MSVPSKNLSLLQQTIPICFAKEYTTEQCKQLIAEIKHYFEHHLYDEDDITEDICEAFEDCCSKAVVYKIFGIKKNHTKRMNVYNKYKQCIMTTVTTPTCSTPLIIDEIDIIIKQLTDQNAAKLCLQKIKEQEFNVDDIKDDIEDKWESEIYQFLVKNQLKNLDKTFDEFRGIINKKETNNTPNKPAVHQEGEVWDMVLEKVKKTNFFNDNNICTKLDEAVNYYKENKFSIEDYMEGEASDVDDWSLSDAFEHLDRSQVHVLWKQFTKSVKSFYPTDLDDDDIPNTKPYQPMKRNDPFSKRNVSYYPSNVFFDSQKSQNYQHMDDIITTMEKLDYVNQMQNVSKLKYDGIALRQFASIYGINTILTFIDLKIAQQCIAFTQPTAFAMREHLKILKQDETRYIVFKKKRKNTNAIVPDGVDAILSAFIQKYFNPKNHNNKKHDMYYCGGMNQLQTKRFLENNQLPLRMMSIRQLDEKENKNNSNNQESDDDDDYEPNFEMSHTDKLNCNAREMQVYIYSFIMTISNYLLEQHPGLNCSVVLNLKLQPQQESFKRYIKTNNVTSEIDSICKKIKRIFFANDSNQKKLAKHLSKYDIPIMEIDFDKEQEHRFTNFQEPSYITYKEKDIGVELNKNDFLNKLEDVILFQIMRIKRQSTVCRMDDKNHAIRRLGISVHKLNKTIRFYLHCGGFIVRFLPKDITTWIPMLFSYRKHELKWNEIITGSNYDWKNLDIDYYKYLYKFSRKIMHLDNMKPYQKVFLPFKKACSKCFSAPCVCIKKTK